MSKWLANKKEYSGEKNINANIYHQLKVNNENQIVLKYFVCCLECKMNYSSDLMEEKNHNLI